MEEKNTKSKKRILYYAILASCALLLIAGIVLTVYFVTEGNRTVIENPPVVDPNDPSGPADPGPHGRAGPCEICGAHRLRGLFGGVFEYL